LVVLKDAVSCLTRERDVPHISRHFDFMACSENCDIKSLAPAVRQRYDARIVTSHAELEPKGQICFGKGLQHDPFAVGGQTFHTQNGAVAIGLNIGRHLGNRRNVGISGMHAPSFHAAFDSVCTAMGDSHVCEGDS
jgi:hypothetical protein